MIYLNNENLDDLITDELVLVDFYADWCGPCKMLSKVLEKIEDKLKIIKVNVDTHSDLASKYGIMSIPNIIFFKNKKVVKSIVGFHSEEELMKIIDEIK